MRSLQLTGITLFLLSAGVSRVFMASAQQTTCPVRQVAAFHGFRLGMIPSDAKKNLEETGEFDETVAAATGGAGGTSSAMIMASQLKADYADGVDNVYLVFVNSRLAVLKVTFNGSDNWKGAQDFFASVSESLGLPKPAGVDRSIRGGGNEKYKIECDRFGVTLAYSFGVSPVVTIYDVVAQKMVDERRDRENTKTINVGPGGTTTIPIRRNPNPPPGGPPE
jgi:hypothetical protein